MTTTGPQESSVPDTAILQETALETLVPRRSGRPTAKRVAEIDAAIRATAREIFLVSGYEATSMDAIAAAAHVSKGTLYARYASKSALFLAVIDDLMDKLSLRAGEQDHLLSDDLEQRLHHHARMLVSAFGWKEYALATRLVFNAEHAFPELAKTWQEKGTKYYVGIIAEDMERSGALPADASIDALFLANLFLYSIAGWYRNELANGPVSESETVSYCNKVIDVIMATIENPPSRFCGLRVTRTG